MVTLNCNTKLIIHFQTNIRITCVWLATRQTRISIIFVIEEFDVIFSLIFLPIKIILLGCHYCKPLWVLFASVKYLYIVVCTLQAFANYAKNWTKKSSDTLACVYQANSWEWFCYFVNVKKITNSLQPVGLVQDQNTLIYFQEGLNCEFLLDSSFRVSPQRGFAR